MQINFLIKNRFWVANLRGKCYKDHMSRSRIENIRYIILWNLKTYDKIVVRLKAIEYKEDFFCYLSS